MSSHLSDLDQCPVIAACIKDLDTGHQYITWVQKAAGKTARDFRRCEEKALEILHWLSGNQEVFDFKNHFLERLALRGGDMSRTELLYHKNLEKELKEDVADAVKKTSRRRLNLKFLLKEGLILASKNQLFK